MSRSDAGSRKVQGLPAKAAYSDKHDQAAKHIAAQCSPGARESGDVPQALHVLYFVLQSSGKATGGQGQRRLSFWQRFAYFPREIASQPYRDEQLQRRSAMVDIDKWLADAANLTKNADAPVNSDKVLQRISASTSPASSALALARHDARLAMLCAAVAAIVALAGLDSIAAKAWEQPVATWISAPPAARRSACSWGMMAHRLRRFALATIAGALFGVLVAGAIVMVRHNAPRPETDLHEMLHRAVPWTPMKSKSWRPKSRHSRSGARR